VVYNGQGEGGVQPTPAAARDHAVSGQGNLAGGNALVWHGASGEDAGHRNAAAQWGVRSKEFGNVAGIALLKQAVKLGETFSDAAVKHETVGLAAHLGAAKARCSMLDEEAAPLQAMLTAVSGMVGAEDIDAARSGAADKDTAPGDGKLPHLSDPVIAIAAKAGLGVTAGQAVQLSNGETVSLMSGQDTQFVTGGQLRVHSGQAIGMLAGAVKPGEGGIGLQLIAAKDAIDVQAQADVLKMRARDEVNVVSANAHVDWAAAKRISLSTADGANITIEGGNITVQCPGKITIHAGKKSFLGATERTYKLPILPQSVCVECLAKRAGQRTAFVNKGA